MKTFTKISKGGQLTVPAAVRKRWGTTRVVVEDEGQRLVIRPIPEDPISALRGMLAGVGPSSDETRKQIHEEEREAEERKWGHLGLR
jgi:AbrB family looped-hinge helix DNA binding protein